jgi:pteridine reductase
MSGKKVAIVTGSGKRRVGRTVAERLAEAGYALVVHYHTSAADAKEAVEQLRARGAEAVAVQADVGDEKAVDHLVQAALDQFGRIDVLVNCASTYQPIPFEKITVDDLRQNYEANLLGTFLCCQKAGLAMVKQPDGGSIVNFGDWASARPYLDYAAYFASKGGIPALTRCLAVELGTRNPRVRVNCIMPGPVLFPPEMPETEKQEAIEATLAQRAGSPEHVAKTVLFLIENDFVTGASLVVDGGRTVFAGG